MLHLTREWSFTDQDITRLCWRIEQVLHPIVLGGFTLRVTAIAHLQTNQTARRAIMHTHQHYESLIIVGGCARYNQGGVVRPGSLLLFPPRNYHGPIALETPYKRLMWTLEISPRLDFAPPIIWPNMPEVLGEVAAL